MPLLTRDETRVALLPSPPLLHSLLASELLVSRKKSTGEKFLTCLRPVGMLKESRMPLV